MLPPTLTGSTKSTFAIWRSITDSGGGGEGGEGGEGGGGGGGGGGIFSLVNVQVMASPGFSVMLTVVAGSFTIVDSTAPVHATPPKSQPDSPPPLKKQSI